ncbi:hypothetical protein BOO71_0004042 [Deinococcus marmoris]|uniref:Uncharacterized protein n=1 Tax=Deinococcus marmoris TaxID=249408 RepID=A0A1U7P1G5_9DEIO|nr:hypothetical protein BOO71_0004042 [Deinococcus marmoris]
MYLLELILPAYVTPNRKRSLYAGLPCESQLKAVQEGKLP